MFAKADKNYAHYYSLPKKKWVRNDAGQLCKYEVIIAPNLHLCEITARHNVTGKIEGRKIAEKYNAKMWNF